MINGKDFKGFFMESFSLRKIRSKISLEKIDEKSRHIGLAYTAFGWFLIALSSIFFSQSRATHSLVNTCFHHYLAAFMTISLWAGFKGKKNFFCKNPFLILFNSFVCMACYYIYFMFRAQPASVNNSYLLNADSICVAIISVFLLRRKIDLLSWAGLFIGFVGVMCFFSFGVDFTTLKSIVDGIVCLCSASALAVLVLLTQYLLKNNPPIIIALSHTLVGLFFSGVLLFFSGWQLPSQFDLFCMVMDGFMYGVALYFFINALYYTEAYIIMSLSYLLPVYLIMINLGLRRGGIDQSMIIGMLLVLVGVAFVPIPVYLKDRKKQWVSPQPTK